MTTRTACRAAIAAMVFVASPAQADGLAPWATYTVTRADDVTADDGQLTLREAVQLALANVQTRSESIRGNHDRILFSLPAGTVITLDSTLDISGDSILIQCASAGTISLRMPGSTAPMFRVTNGATFSDLWLWGIVLEGQHLPRTAAVEVDDAYLAMTGVTVQHVNAYVPGGAPLVARSPRALELWHAVFADNSGTEAGAIAVDAPLSAQSFSIRNSGFYTNVGDGSGGAVRFNAPLATLEITDSNFTLNSAQQDGGGVLSSVAVLNIERSTFADNVAGSRGGGLAVAGGTVALTNSTVTGNQAATGGGIHARLADDQDVLLRFVTLVDNVAADTGGVHVVKSAPMNGVSGTHSIVSGNVSTGDSAFNQFGPLSTSMLEHSFIGGVPRLSPLEWKSGLTPTREPVPGSPVIDAGNHASLADVPLTDQRGAARVTGSNVDIGAVEYVPPASAGGGGSGGLALLLGLLLLSRRRSP